MENNGNGSVHAASESHLKLHRLQSNDPVSWGMYPAYETRVSQFLTQYSPDFDNDQRSMFLTEMRTRFAATPALAGYWLFIDEEGGLLGRHVVGHVASWIVTVYDRPYLLLYQLEIDEKFHSREIFLKLYQEAREWVAGLNTQLAEKGSKQITMLEHWSRASAAVWNRWLPELKQRQVLNVIRFSV